MTTIEIKPLYLLYGMVAVALLFSGIAMYQVHSVEADGDFEKIVSENIDDSQIISIYQNSEQWDWIKDQVTNAEETEDIVLLSKRVDMLSKEIDVLEAKLDRVDNPPSSSMKNEVVSLYTSDNDGNKEDRFRQGEIAYFYVTVDTKETNLDYAIVNGDTDDKVKSKRLSIPASGSQLVWAWVIPENQTIGEYYLEVEVGNTIKKVEFIVK